MAKRMIEKRMIEIIQICQYKIDISTWMWLFLLLTSHVELILRPAKEPCGVEKYPPPARGYRAFPYSCSYPLCTCDHIVQIVIKARHQVFYTHSSNYVHAREYSWNNFCIVLFLLLLCYFLSFSMHMSIQYFIWYIYSITPFIVGAYGIPQSN